MIRIGSSRINRSKVSIHTFLEMKRKRTKTNYSNTKKKKFFDLSRSSVNQLDDLSNELLYEIFDYLDHYDLYRSFFDYNQRFQNLLLHSILPIRMNISSLSKSNFEEYYQTMIKFNQHRIISLHLSDVFIIEMFFSPAQLICQLIRLETLILDHIESNHLEKILEYAVSLPNLCSLTIHPRNDVNNSHEIFSRIFCLPHLKFCKVTGDQMSDCQMSPNTNDQFSPIEYLLIDDLEFDYFDHFLSYVPQLRYFSLACLDGVYAKRKELSSMKVNHLRYLSMDFHQVYFNQFEQLIKNTFHHIEEFHLTAGRDQTYADAKRWERLISTDLLNLRVFDLNYDGSIDDDQLSEDTLSKNFHSSFWTERNTLFIYRNRYYGNISIKIFYSIDSFKKINYRSLEIDNTHSVAFQEKILANSVDHILIKNKEALDTCQNYFPNVTTLTLDHNLIYIYLPFSNDLNRIIPLSQITKLIVESDSIRLRLLIDILRLTPNVHTLKCYLSSIIGTLFPSLEQNEHFLFVSKTNTIKNVNLIGKCSREYWQNIVMFFPRAEKLKMGIERKELNLFILFLFSKSNESTSRLFSLGMTMMPKVCVREVKKLIKSEKLLAHYSIKHIDQDLYLWW